MVPLHPSHRVCASCNHPFQIETEADHSVNIVLLRAPPPHHKCPLPAYSFSEPQTLPSHLLLPQITPCNLPVALQAAGAPFAARLLLPASHPPKLHLPLPICTFLLPSCTSCLLSSTFTDTTLGSSPPAASTPLPPSARACAAPSTSAYPTPLAVTLFPLRGPALMPHLST